MEWISVTERLPEIPAGRYGTAVLTARFDPAYAECNPGRGYTVREGHYGIVRYAKMPMFAGSVHPDGSQAFMELWSGRAGSTWGPTGDQVTHWMPLPDPPATPPKQ